LTTDERERLYTLCGQIVEEKDAFKFLQLVNELNDLLDRKEERLECSTAPRQDS